MRLLGQIGENHERPVLFASGNPSLTSGHLLDWASLPAMQSWASAFAGGSVGLCCRDNLSLALLLLALDGVASRLTLLPSDLPAEVIAGIAEAADVQRMISDREDAPAIGIPLAEMFPSLASLTQSGPDYPEMGGIATEWVLPTSGTTRTPKLVAHTVHSLTRTVKRDPRQGAELRWGLLYDLNRFAGLQVFLQALLGGASLIIPPLGANLDQTLKAFLAAGCNSLSATPTLWRKLLMTPESERLQLRQITLGGEIADQSILLALATAFPAARIRHIYASTEAGVGFSVTDGKEGFPISYLHGGVPGVELCISPDGILKIRPSVREQHYLGESQPLADSQGFVNTGDRVRIDGERVHFLGRDSGAINVGGNKVQPEKIERILLAHPAVAMASVVAKRSGITGSLVEARVMLHPQEAAGTSLIPEIRQWCAGRLERFEVPALIRIVTDIELNPSGKITRN